MTNSDGGSAFVTGEAWGGTRENFYFWLGADGELEEVNASDFETRVGKTRSDKENWANVTTDGDGGTIV